MIKSIEFYPHLKGMRIAFYLKGELGAVQFKMTAIQYGMRHDVFHIMPTDLGYHSPKPRYEDQTLTTNNCEVINKPCYYDGSRLNAEPVFNILMTLGHDGVWAELENYYKRLFKELR